MKVKTFYPILCALETDGAIKELEVFDFEVKHDVENINDGRNENVVLKDENGNRADVIKVSQGSTFVAIRANVENFEEAYAELVSKGFIDLFPGGVDSKSAKSTMLRSPSGFMYLICEHKK